MVSYHCFRSYSTRSSRFGTSRLTRKSWHAKTKSTTSKWPNLPKCTRIWAILLEVLFLPQDEISELVGNPTADVSIFHWPMQKPDQQNTLNHSLKPSFRERTVSKGTGTEVPVYGVLRSAVPIGRTVPVSPVPCRFD